MSGGQTSGEAAGARQRRRTSPSPEREDQEGLSSAPATHELSPMYPKEEHSAGGISSSVSYLDGAYEFPNPTQTYGTSSPAEPASVGYYPAPPDPHSAPAEEHLQTLGTGSASPLIFAPSSPQLSPYLNHHGAHHSTHQVSYYLDTPSSTVYRSSVVCSQQAGIGLCDELCSATDRQELYSGSRAAGVFDSEKEMRFCAVCSDYASGYHYGLIGKGENHSLPCARSDERLPDVYNGSTQMFLLAPYLQFGILLEGGADLGGFWQDERPGGYFEIDLGMQAPDELFPGAGHNDYVCPATNQCTIDRNRRKSCQACRLRKCYEVGMMKGGIRKDRGGRAIRCERRRSANEDRVKSYSEQSSRTGLRTAPLQDRRKKSGGGVVSASGMPPDQVLMLLLGAEPPAVCSRQKHSRPYTEITMMSLLTNMADKELVHMIAWAKKVPGFQDLSLHDQVQLLESSWLEVLMIGLIWRSIHSPGKLIFAQDLILDRSEGECVEGMAEIFDMLLATVARFRSLKLKLEEFVCLKAIILLNSALTNHFKTEKVGDPDSLFLSKHPNLPIIEGLKCGVHGNYITAILGVERDHSGDYLGCIIDCGDLPLKPEEVSTLFCNIEDIYEFNRDNVQMSAKSKYTPFLMHSSRLSLDCCSYSGMLFRRRFLSRPKAAGLRGRAQAPVVNEPHMTCQRVRVQPSEQCILGQQTGLILFPQTSVQL
nr:estrogen receptor 1 [Osteobrama belangeri]